MAEVNLNINGKIYPILCDDGQEQRIQDLAAHINARLKDITDAGAANNDNHALVLTSLILADEIFELQENLTVADQLMTEDNGQSALRPSEEKAVADAIGSIANRIKIVSQRIKQA